MRIFSGIIGTLIVNFTYLIKMFIVGFLLTAVIASATKFLFKSEMIADLSVFGFWIFMVWKVWQRLFGDVRHFVSREVKYEINDNVVSESNGNITVIKVLGHQITLNGDNHTVSYKTSELPGQKPLRVQGNLDSVYNTKDFFDVPITKIIFDYSYDAEFVAPKSDKIIGRYTPGPLEVIKGHDGFAVQTKNIIFRIYNEKIDPKNLICAIRIDEQYSKKIWDTVTTFQEKSFTFFEEGILNNLQREAKKSAINTQPDTKNWWYANKIRFITGDMNHIFLKENKEYVSKLPLIPKEYIANKDFEKIAPIAIDYYIFIDTANNLFIHSNPNCKDQTFNNGTWNKYIKVKATDIIEMDRNDNVVGFKINDPEYMEQQGINRRVSFEFRTGDIAIEWMDRIKNISDKFK